MIRLRRPTKEQLRPLAEEGKGAALTYEPAGLVRLTEPPDGFRQDTWQRSLGRAEGTFDVAAGTLRDWGVQRGAGLVVLADGPPSIGAVVTMSAPLPVGYVDVVCRVVDVVDEPDRCSFTYGTLPVHPEEGEESFAVERSADGEVTFRITAVSRPRHVLARACPPVARHLQRAATDRYLDAMARSVAEKLAS
jgi:uncharacterized protein (UPF0548 family)